MTNLSPKVSVVIPCYNQGHYVAEAVESVLAQTFQDFEIIVVNDGSTDADTIEILKKLSWPKTKVIHSDNQGLGGARNLGIQHATGIYILPLDADDKIAPTYMEKGIRVLEERPEIGIVYCEAELFGDQNGRWHLPPYQFPDVLLFPRIFSCAFFRRRDWERVSGYFLGMGSIWEDCEFWLSLIEIGCGVYRIPEPLFFYRRTRQSISRGLSREQIVSSYQKLFTRHQKLYLENIASLFATAFDTAQERDRMGAALQSNNAALESSNAALAVSNTALESTNASLAVSNTALESTRAALESTKAALESSNAELAQIKGTFLYKLGMKTRKLWKKITRSKTLKDTPPLPFKFHLDSPGRGFFQIAPRKILVKGWAFDARQESARAMFIKIGKRRISGKTHISRPDVSAVLGENVPKQCGFRTECVLNNGLSLLRIKVEMSDGKTVTIRRHWFLKFPVLDEIKFWPERIHKSLLAFLKPDQVSVFAPPSSGDLYSGVDNLDLGLFTGRTIRISGWCFFEPGILPEKIEMRVGKRRFIAQLGMRRTDVAAGFKDREKRVLLSGFELSGRLPSLARKLDLWAYRADGQRFLIQRVYLNPFRLCVLSLREKLLRWKSKLSRMRQTIGRQRRLQKERFSWQQHAAGLPLSGPASKKDARVDVIIPVYKDYDVTRACLESVLRHPQKTLFEIVVVNDLSPDPEIHAFLRDLAAKGKITLINNKENLGFVRSSNLGMALHPNRDVLLLNSDTEVFHNWMDRIYDCAYSCSKIATVTPFSNNATVCSYPVMAQDNNAPLKIDDASLDKLFMQLESVPAVDLPTAVGFCMFIKRTCLTELGFFDDGLFGLGYGEENDFCLRAAAAGWRNVICSNVFVRHKGSCSFGNLQRAERCRQAEEIINNLYPGYDQTVNDFIKQDPLRIYRLQIDVARLRQSEKPIIVAITHHLGGGTEKHIVDLARHLSEQARFVKLSPVTTAGQDFKLVDLHTGQSINCLSNQTHQYGELLKTLRQLQPARIHFHHTLHLPKTLWNLPRDLGIPYDFTIHDYHSICPQINLTTPGGFYCGEPDESECNQCLQKRPVEQNKLIGPWRQEYRCLLEQAERVFVPSLDCYGRIQKYFPDANLIFCPHPEVIRSKQPLDHPVLTVKKIRRVAAIGALSLIKGADILEAAALDSAQRKLPLEFHLIGYPYRPLQTHPQVPLQITGPYNDADLPALIKELQIDAIWFPALCPETYCYVLSAAMASGLPIFAPNLGAFPERLKARVQSWIAPWRTTPAQWNDFFLDPSLLPALASNDKNGKHSEPGKVFDYLTDYVHLRAHKRSQIGLAQLLAPKP